VIHWKVRRETTLRPIIPTAAQAKSLSRLYYRVMNVWAVGARDKILPAYERTLSQMMTDSVSDIEVSIEETQGEAVRAIFSFRWWFGSWFDSLISWHTQKLVSNLKYATNIDLASVIGPLPQDTVEATIARNVALVRNVSDQTRQKISDIVYRGLTQRLPARDVAKEINDVLKLGRARSTRIASDQLVKASAALDRSRMLDLGIVKFRWAHSHKLHYRPWHRARDGEVFRFDDPKLRGDLPGDQPFCGCKAQGVIE
jgi:SPP1 gp7 family putative phage head morphogenesis protein